MSKVYNKLVRDKIPQIIGEEKCECFNANGNYLEYNIIKKLFEEVNEINSSDNDSVIEECIDLEEVLRAYIAFQGYSIRKFNRMRRKKARERGAFKNGTILYSVEEEEQWKN